MNTQMGVQARGTWPLTVIRGLVMGWVGMGFGLLMTCRGASLVLCGSWLDLVSDDGFVVHLQVPSGLQDILKQRETL